MAFCPYCCGRFYRLTPDQVYCTPEHKVRARLVREWSARRVQARAIRRAKAFTARRGDGSVTG